MRKFYAFMLFAILSISAFAETDPNYYWYYEKVEAAPTGKGTVYASDYSEPPTSDSDYAASKEIKFNTHTSFDIFTAWAKPAAGYQLAGWFSTASDETTMADRVADGEEASISVTTEQVSEDDTVEGYALTPNVTYAIFTKVKVCAAEGLGDAATLDISKVANDTGDEVTITATPNEKVEFAYWLDSKGNKITQNPYTFTVNDMDTYTAYFKGDAILTIDFGEGKYIPFSNKCNMILNSDVVGYRIEEVNKNFEDGEGHMIEFDEVQNAWGYYEYEYDDDGNVTDSKFYEYTGEVPTFESSYKLSDFMYNYNAGDGVILYSKGEQSFYMTETEVTYPWVGSLLVATCDGAVDIASLPEKDDDGNAITYYTFNGEDFVKATSGVVAKDQCFLTLTSNQYPQPDKILVANSELATDIQDINVQPALQFQGIYTIDGKHVTAPVKGSINLIGNRKVWINK